MELDIDRRNQKISKYRKHSVIYLSTATQQESSLVFFFGFKISVDLNCFNYGHNWDIAVKIYFVYVSVFLAEIF